MRHPPTRRVGANDGLLFLQAPPRNCWRGVVLAAALTLVGAAGAQELIPNGGFEHGLGAWGQWWTRQPHTGQIAWDANVGHGGAGSARIEYRGPADWSFSTGKTIPVHAGDLFQLSGWLKIKGKGNATLGVVLRNAGGKVLDWSFGGASADGPTDWRPVRSRFVIPRGAASIEPRLIGSEPATVWVDDVSLRRTGDLASLRRPGLPATLTLTNPVLTVVFKSSDATFTVTDHRTGQRWHQHLSAPNLIVREATVNGRRLTYRLLDLPANLNLTSTVELDATRPEFTLTLAGSGQLNQALRYPAPFVTDTNTYLVVPMNEGISYPVGDRTITPMRLIAYGGHGICMAFWGVTDGQRGQMAIIVTPDDAAIRIDRANGRLFIAPEWDPQMGRFGYSRKLRYVFFNHGGYVAMAKRYRAYVKARGRLKTLAEKRRENPNVDLLIGAVNVWCWDGNAVRYVREMQRLGIRHILWSHRQPPSVVRTLNSLGVLTSRYDIYQDVMNPANFRFLRGVDSDWTTAAWPKDLVRDARGNWVHGWKVRGTNGVWYACGVLCDRQARAYAARRIPADLKTHPYRCRFIDTATASPWRECYAPAHRMTRTQSREWRMKLLNYVSHDMKLVTGSETGHDAAVPYVDYFEGMLSLGPYRVPDAGRNMLRIWNHVPPRVAKFQLGQRYRLPLWELVYHDCVVAQWYWGDYSNKLPTLWDKRNLFNILYGTPPMFMFNHRIWEQNKARFAQSYHNICPLVRRVGYLEMTNHRFLTPNRDVQQSVFADGTTVTVNFGTKPYRLGNHTISPLGFWVTH